VQKHGGQSTVTFVENADKSLRGALKVLKNGNQKRGLIRERRARMRREVVALETLRGASGIPFVLDHNTEFFEVLSIDLYVVQEFIEGIKQIKELFFLFINLTGLPLTRFNQMMARE
jgi:serine/threonine protein kinase